MPRKERYISIAICMICVVASIWCAARTKESWGPVGFTVMGIAHSGLASKLILQQEG